jgi:hypothetical protein
MIPAVIEALVIGQSAAVMRERDIVPGELQQRATGAGEQASGAQAYYARQKRAERAAVRPCRAEAEMFASRSYGWAKLNGADKKMKKF